YTLISIPLPYFFFTAPAPTDIYPLSLHDALPISRRPFDRHAVAVPHQSQGRVGHLRLLARDLLAAGRHRAVQGRGAGDECAATGDRKSTRLNSSHLVISYAVFCLKKKTNTVTQKS